MKQIKIASGFQDDKISCPQCQSKNHHKAGKYKSNGKQRYKCKDCGRKFTETALDSNKSIQARYVLPQNISADEMKYYDVWDLRILGKKTAKTSGTLTKK